MGSAGGLAIISRGPNSPASPASSQRGIASLVRYAVPIAGSGPDSGEISGGCPFVPGESGTEGKGSYGLIGSGTAIESIISRQCMTANVILRTGSSCAATLITLLFHRPPAMILFLSFPSSLALLLPSLPFSLLRYRDLRQRCPSSAPTGNQFGTSGSFLADAPLGSYEQHLISAGSRLVWRTDSGPSPIRPPSTQLLII